MKTTHRAFSYESDDFTRMCRFVADDNRARGGRAIWHLGRMVDWKYGLYNPVKFMPDNFAKEAELWFDAFGDVCGMVLSEDFGSELTLLVRRQWEHLAPEMLVFAKVHWGNRYDALTFSLPEGETAIEAALVNAGFSLQDTLEITNVFDTARFAEAVLHIPDGFRFESMAENGDYTSHDNMRRNAFQSTCEPELDRLLRDYTRRSPIYMPETDFVLIDADGRHVSGCEAFIDRWNGLAEIERVCTIREEWGKGYARQVLTGCLRRLYALGIPRAVLAGSYDKTRHLYGSLGHVDAYNRLSYEWKKQVR